MLQNTMGSDHSTCAHTHAPAATYTTYINSLVNTDMSKLPVLSGNYCGITGYIDRLPYEELVSPIMRGIDKGRIFIAIRCFIVDTLNNRYPVAQVFHQRYTNDDSVWVSNGLSYEKAIFSSCELQLKSRRIISDLITYGRADIQPGEELTEKLGTCCSRAADCPIDITMGLEHTLKQHNAKLAYFTI